jgi:hypothetical protein
MAGTPDGTPTPGPPRGAEETLSAAEGAHLAARETVPIDVRQDQLARRETVRLPGQRGSGGGRARPRRPPLALAAGVAVGWACVVSATPVVLVLALAQLVEGGGSLLAVLRLGFAGWLLGHGVPVDTGAGRLALAPLGLAVLAAWRVARAGVHTTRAIGARRSGTPGRALTVAAAVGIGYGVLGGLAAMIVGTGTPGVSPPRAAAQLAAFGLVFGMLGAAWATGAAATVTRRLPPALRDGVRAGVVTTLLLLGAAAATAGISLAVGGGEAAEVLGAYRTGVAGQAGITLVCLAYAPNCAVWAAAYLLGPGFAVGTDTVVRVSDVTVGGLPAIPVFAGLPAGPLGATGAVLVALPVLVGAVGGALMVRRRARAAAERPVRRTRAAPRDGLPPELAWRALLGGAAIAGPVAGLLLGIAALASAGSLGAGRLAEVGPVAWQVAVISTVVVTLGTAVGVAAARAVRA